MGKRGTIIFILMFLMIFRSSWAICDEAEYLEEIVVYGKEEPVNEESLSMRAVRESPARDVGEALKAGEGISIVRRGAIANDVVLRGMTRDDINVLIDGARLYGGCPNRMDSPAFHVDFAEVEEIRIIKGPYDTANPGSLGGTLLIETREPPPGFRGEVNACYGSYDSKAASGSVSFRSDRFEGLAGYSYKDSLPPVSGDGRRITEIYPPDHTHRYRRGAEDSRAYVLNTAWTKWGVRPTDHSSIGLGYAYQDASHVLYPYLLMDADYDRTHRLNGSFVIDDLPGALDELEVRAYWDRVDHLMDNRLREPAVGTPEEFSMRADADSSVVGGKLQVRMTLALEGALMIGLDYYNRAWDVENIQYRKAAGTVVVQPMIPGVVADNAGLFFDYERTFCEAFGLRLGLRGDLIRVKAEDLNAARLGALYQPYYGDRHLEPSADFREVSGNLQLTYAPMEGLEIFVGLGRGVRPPDPQELYIGIERGSSNWVGNPALEASKNTQADLGAKWFSDTLYLSVSFFANRVEDSIHVIDLPDPDGEMPMSLIKARSYENIDAGYAGGELGSILSLPHDLYLNLSLSFVRAENRSDDRPLSEIPPFKGSAGIRYDNDFFFIAVDENFAVRQDRVDEALMEAETAGWATTDIRAGLRYKGLSLYGGLMNLFDKHYYSHLSYQRDPFSSGVKVPENGRNFYLTATYDF